MKHEIDLSKYNVRTDIILDETQDYENKINLQTETIDNIKITSVSLTDETSKLLNKKNGNYVTIEFEDATDSNNASKISEIFSKELRKLMDSLKIKKNDNCLIIGLGNSKSTPDSLGPSVIDDIIVTKHLYDMKLSVEDCFRNVAAIAPGVMGVTGIETSDIILNLINIVNPKFLIVVDSLASLSIDRVNKTIQMTDTGIHPGSGIGNCRKEISKEIVGIPVIAIGIPTVVDAVTIVADTIDFMEKHFSYKKTRIDKKGDKLIPKNMDNYLRKESKKLSNDEKQKIFGMLGSLSDDEMRELVYEVLSPIGYNLMVTPKEIDFQIKKLSEILSQGINNAIHEINIVIK